MVQICKPLKQNEIETHMAIHALEQKFCAIQQKSKANRYRQLIANIVGEKKDHNFHKFFLCHKKYCFLQAKFKKLLK